MNKFTPTQAEFDQLRDGMLSKVETWDRKRSTRLKVGAIGAAGVLALAGMGAAWVALASPELRETAVYCYQSASTDSLMSTVTDADAVREGVPTAKSAVELCAAAWQVGVFGGNPDQEGKYTVPVLQACTRLDGVRAVFPIEPGAEADSFCRGLGLGS
ncbi:hypothetical protein [Agromyces sp. NPDC055658]